MSGKLDQSLDDILKSRKSGPRRTTHRVVRKTRATAPAGGVTKVKKATTTSKTTAAVPPPATGESKIIVSGLPSDVTEVQIKEYFAKTIGPVKKVFLNYGPQGQSRGISTIVFTKPTSAHEAATQLNGVKVDNRAMKIEVIVGAKQAAAAPIVAKALGERIAPTKAAAAAKSKNQPRSAVTAAAAANGKRTGAAASKRGRGRNVARAKPKTAAELDAEMTDYFGGGTNPATSGTANGGTRSAAATGGDTGMEDEIM